MIVAESQTIPAEVASAIVKVMTGVKTLGKDDTNKFQKYDFVSVDRFLAAVGPLCAGAGLIILQEEDSFDISVKETSDDYGKTKTSSWLTVRYAFTFVHASGAAYGPLHRSVIVPASGAQAFGSAQSYALKQFQRAQFQIPTGDSDDVDSQQAQPLPNQSRQRQETPFDKPTPTRQTEPAPKREETSFWKRETLDLDPKAEAPIEALGKTMLATINKAPGEKELNRFVQHNDYHIEQIGRDYPELSEAISGAISAKMGAFMAM